MARSRVAVLKTSPATVLEDYRRLTELAGMQGVLRRGATTILKDNISWHFPFPGANTTPWQLEGVIKCLQGAGYRELACVGNKTVVTDAFKGDDLNKLKPVLRKYEVPLLYNFKPQDMQWVRYYPKAKMQTLGNIYPEGIFIPDYFSGRNIVHLPTVKCHIYTTTTGAVKNAFGGLLATKRHYSHSWIHETLADLLAIQQEIHPGLFAVMDGTTAGNGPGPRTMRPEIKNMMLASADQVAIDAVAAKMMGFDPMAIGYIRLAHERGLGCGRVEEIDVTGEDIRGVNWHFHVGTNLVRRVGGDLIWFGPLKKLQHLFFHTPLVHVFILASEIYHDYFRWPLIDRRVFTKWLKETSWGRLFQEYPGSQQATDTGTKR
jgi:uncharacterized protein (DUF362 family)